MQNKRKHLLIRKEILIGKAEPNVSF